jgi:hypothetical protein
MLDKVRTGFSWWASSTYTNKLIKRRKITDGRAAVLNDREQAYTEHDNGAEARSLYLRENGPSGSMDLPCAVLH